MVTLAPADQPCEGQRPTTPSFAGLNVRLVTPHRNDKTTSLFKVLQAFRSVSGTAPFHFAELIDSIYQEMEYSLTKPFEDRRPILLRAEWRVIPSEVIARMKRMNALHNHRLKS